MTKLKYAKNDSERFGLVIHRAITDKIDNHDILEQILDNNVDIAIIRIPTTKLGEIHKLEKTGMPFMITDTLAYYHFDLLSYQKQEMHNKGLEFKLACQDDHPDLHRIVRDTFGNYVNHYRMNPFLDNEHVTEGYQDWMGSYANNGNDNRLCWLVYLEGELVGFASFNAEKEPKVKGILYGVLPSQRGKGIFRDIMYFAKNYFKDQGKEYMRVTTQTENIAVQKVWTSTGFILHHHENTIHINSLLNKSVFDRFQVDIEIKEQDMNTNKVSNRHILKRINFHLDFKRNIMTQNHRFVNIKPLKPNQTYMIHFSFPVGSKGLARVEDHEGKAAALVYYDLKHFVA